MSRTSFFIFAAFAAHAMVTNQQQQLKTLRLQSTLLMEAVGVPIFTP